MQPKPLAATQKSTSFHKVSLKLVPKISYDAWKRDDANVPPSKPRSKSEHSYFETEHNFSRLNFIPHTADNSTL